MSDRREEDLAQVLIEIRNWIRVAAHDLVKRRLESALPDDKMRAANQILDGTASIEQVRVACKMSPNAVIAFANRCEAMGLMEVNQDKKRVSLFDLVDFGVIGASDPSKSGGKQ